MALRRPGLTASRVIASLHSSAVSTRKPVLPSWTISRFMPTGLATTGSPAAIYCKTLSPHLPRLHGSLGNQLIPMSQLATSAASVEADHCRGTTSMPVKLGNLLQITDSSSPAQFEAAAASKGSAKLRQG